MALTDIVFQPTNTQGVVLEFPSGILNAPLDIVWDKDFLDNIPEDIIEYIHVFV